MCPKQNEPSHPYRRHLPPHCLHSPNLYHLSWWWFHPFNCSGPPKFYHHPWLLPFSQSHIHLINKSCWLCLNISSTWLSASLLLSSWSKLPIGILTDLPASSLVSRQTIFITAAREMLQTVSQILLLLCSPSHSESLCWPARHERMVTTLSFLSLLWLFIPLPPSDS